MKCLYIDLSDESAINFFETYCQLPISASEYSFLLFLYSQAMGDKQNFKACYKYGVYSCNLQTLYEFKQNIPILKDSLNDSFSIDLNY